MVDLANLQQINMLSSELNAFDAAERAFDNGGVIVSMEVSSRDPSEQPSPQQAPTFPIRVPTVNIPYPPQMVNEIKAKFAQRRQAIENELADLGLTGIETR